MHYGFVLDQGACIGCHACTVACKAENDVPLGEFRTWVKWIEHGQFPDTQRSAAVLRCNHCAEAPCIEICPTVALSKRPDGIVDIDRDRCIGCSSCLQACPYDAIHIDERSGTAAKCHFCAHRVEVGLAPACVAVCPEQAIKVVDLDNRSTRRELGRRGATVRKPERGTRPRTYYLDTDPIALDPLAVDGARTLSHAEVPDPMPAAGNAEARAVYDVPRKRQWGNGIAAYMAVKAVAAGALLGAAVSPWAPQLDARILGWISLAAVALTSFLLVADLHKPKRFLFLLFKPNTRSWLVRGAWVLMAHGALSLPWALGFSDKALGALCIPVALLTAVYTAFLFWQARGRELWSEDRFLPWVLAVQAMVAALALAWFFGARGFVGAGGMALLLAYPLLIGASALAPQKTAQATRAHRLMVRHPAFGLGLVLGALAVFVPPLVFASFLSLDWIYVKAGQEVPLS
jgi:Fe-S-cluster-containing dehydrogenase component